MSFDMLANLPLDKIMAIMNKYKDVDIASAKIKFDIYDNALLIKVLTDSGEVGEMFTEFLPIIFSQIPEENLEITDHRG